MKTRLIIFFVIIFQSVANITPAKKGYHFKQNFTKPVTTYNLLSRYDGTSKILKKNYTNRYCFLKEKVESLFAYEVV